MAHQVFICHSSRDKAVADAACSALEAEGIGCWIAPRDVLAGVEYGKAIMDALTGCKVVLVIFSRHADESPQVRREIERAVSKDKTLLPFRIEDVLPSDAMEYALSNTHWLDAFTPPMKGHLEEFCQTVSRLLGSKQAVPVVTERMEPVVPHPSGNASLRRKAWMWGGGVVALALLLILGIVMFRPRAVVVRNNAAVGAPTVPKPDVAAMEAEADRLYHDKQFGSAFPLAKSACDAGDASGCNYEAAMYLIGEGTPKDEVRAAELYRKACDGGKPAGCSNLAAMYENGKGIGQDDDQALVYYRKSCDGGYPIGCTAVGNIYEHGHGVPVNPLQATVFYEKGCDGGYMLGCARLGGLYFDGRGVSQDQVRGLNLYREACEGKYLQACDFVSTHTP